MTSSSFEAGTGAMTAPVPATAHPRVTPFASRDLRTGGWTRLGSSTVLGDAVTEHTLAGLVEETRAAARAQGYATGWSEGRKAAEERGEELARLTTAQHELEQERRDAEHQAAVEALVAAAARLDEALRSTCARVEAHAAEIAVNLTEQLLDHELSVVTSPGLDAVRRALALVPGEPVVRIRLSPLQAADPALAALAGSAVVVADPTLADGDALVETAESVIDARVSGAMARVREVLAP
jgi:flagellar assembly protein FliH